MANRSAKPEVRSEVADFLIAAAQGIDRPCIVPTPPPGPRDKLLATFDHLGPIEQSLVVEFATRLGVGQSQYGRFKADDKRDFAKEAWEEVTDALVYVSRELAKLRAG